MAAPSTDPYEATEEPHPDRLADKPSTTPLMISSGGVVRVIILVGIALFMLHGKARTQRQAPVETIFGGQRFPPEIKIHGSHQYAVGGGPAPFGALAVYASSRTPGWMAGAFGSKPSEPTTRARALDAQGHASVFDALATSNGDVSLLVQFDGHAPGASLGPLLGDALVATVDAEGVAALAAALAKAMEGASVPPTGAQLYMTCDRQSVHLAYGGPAEGKRVRNMAAVTASLENYAYTATGLCKALFDAFLDSASPIAQEAKTGVVAALAAHHAVGDKHDEL